MQQARARVLTVGCGWLLASLTFAGCANKLDGGLALPGDGSIGDGGFAEGGGQYGNGGNGSGNKGNLDGGIPLDAMPTVDAFFINDPAPPHCATDGTMTAAENPGGTPTCPDDKNREGCPCTKADETAACWPGKRLNREHGICKDGVAKCIQTTEFGLRWGACNGYVLPKTGAVQGPDACDCFAGGTWTVTDLAPCIYQGGGKTFLYSSHLDSAGKIACNTVTATPPAVPPEDWNSSTLKAPCAGKFNLCYTIKSGDVNNPKADDCVINRQCLDVAYETENVTTPLKNLTGWSSSDSTCGQKFVDVGGYGEMSVEGKSVECDVVDNGAGEPYIFRRTSYCPRDA